MDDLLNDFLVESNENLERLDQEVVELESHPDNLEILKSIFRTIHTVKGSCGFLGLARMEKVAHAAEDVLGKMRDGDLPVAPDTIGPVLEAIDTIKAILAGLESESVEPQGDDSQVISALRGVLDRAVSGDTESPGVEDQSFEEAFQAALKAKAEGSTDVASPEDSPTAESPAAALPAAKAATKAGDAVSDTGQAPTVSVSAQSLRVTVEVLDRLMNRVGELVLVRNQIGQLANSDENSKYQASIIELNRVTTEIQEAVMQTRMREVGNAWKKIPRILRDLTSATGKKIQLNMVGAETELDRQVLDAIESPFIHMVRNSADHGIQGPEARREQGKPEVGTINLSAHHEGGYVIIEITDDGAGIDVEVIRRKAC